MSNNIMDEIAQEVAQLTDEEIARAAAAIQQRRAKAKAAMSPDRKERMKERERRKRLLQKAILQLAREKGLLAEAQERADASAGANA
jgi:hypothetical protein